jgi:hypothetical protein
LCELALARDDVDEAIKNGQQAAEVFRLLNSPRYEIQALTMLSDAYLARGDSDTAGALAEQTAALRIKLAGDAEFS